MAKRGILEHVKTMELADSLGIMEPFAVGLLEVFWHWVAKYHPRGEITGTKPYLFARAIRYAGDAEKLWCALEGCGFIDRVESDRLLVHDWSEHADNAVHQLLKKRGESFADGNQPFSRQFSRQRKEEEKDVHKPNVNSSQTVWQSQSQSQSQKKTKPSRGKREVDPRHAEFRKSAGAYWDHKNPNLQMPWDAGEARQLSVLLSSNPNLTDEVFHNLLRNRARSHVNHSERPRAWLAKITDYASGPLDKYGKPLDSSDVIPMKPVTLKEKLERQERTQ